MSKTTETKIENLKLENIFPSKTNPRKSFDEKGLQELAESIKEYGLLQPILVRPILDDFDKDLKPNYEIIYGERRYRASVLAKMTTIKAQIEYMDDDKAFEIQVLENLQREDVSPLDEARAFHSLMKKESLDWLASKINKSKKYVLDRVKLLDLCDFAMETLEAGVLPIGHAMLLSKIDKVVQRNIMNSLSLITNINMSKDKNDYTHSYCTKTMSSLKDSIAGLMLSFDKANFDLNDENLLPKAGSCQVCPKRTINENLLFGDITHKDMCTDTLCFNSKIKTQLEVNLAGAKEKYGKILMAEKNPYSGSEQVRVGGKDVYFTDKKTESNSVPAIINKADNWSQKYIGKVVWIEPKKEVEDIEQKPKGLDSWEIRQNKITDEVVIPRYKEVFDKLLSDIPITIIESENCLNIVDDFLIENLVAGSFNKIIIVCNLLGIKTDVELDAQILREYKDSLSRNEQYNLQFELSKKLVNSHSIEMICNILLLDDIVEKDIEMDEEIEAWEISIKRYYETIGLLEKPIEEIETDVEEIPVEQPSITERVKERAKKLK